MKTIDLNCDLGEGFGAWEMGNDAAMIDLASSVNVACGFHAGDPDIMRRTVELAKARGVSVGAHPGYRDLHGFGRHPIAGLKASEIENLVAYQIGALQAIATAAGHKVTHVKAHGALSNVACEDDMTAKAIAAGIKAVDPSLIFVVLANSKLVKAGEDANLPMVHEVFADRAYEDDGNLVSRKKPGAVLHDPRVIADRVVRMVQDGAVVSIYYTLTNDAGEVLDTNRKGGAAMAYLHGSGNIVPGLEKALLGATKGQTIQAAVAPEDAYGPVNDELLEQVPRSSFPPDAPVEAGRIFQGQQPDGTPLQVKIAKVEGDEVTVDRNHPLAGQTLNFNVTIDKIRAATDEEKTHGHAHGAGGHQH